MSRNTESHTERNRYKAIIKDVLAGLLADFILRLLRVLAVAVGMLIL